MEYEEIIDFTSKFANVLGISALSIYLLVYQYVKSKGISIRSYKSNVFALVCLSVYYYYLLTSMSYIGLDISAWVTIASILYTNVEFILKIKPSFTIIKWKDKPYLLLEYKNDKLKAQSLEQFSQSNKKSVVDSIGNKKINRNRYTIIYTSDDIDFYEFDIFNVDYSRYFKSGGFWWLVLSNLLLVALVIFVFIKLPYIKIILPFLNFYMISFVIFFPKLRYDLYEYKYKLQEYHLANIDKQQPT